MSSDGDGVGEPFVDAGFGMADLCVFATAAPALRIRAVPLISHHPLVNTLFVAATPRRARVQQLHAVDQCNDYNVIASS